MFLRVWRFAFILTILLFFSQYKFKMKKEDMPVIVQKWLEAIVISFFYLWKEKFLTYYQWLELKSAVTETCITVSMQFAYGSVPIVVDVWISSLYHKKSLISKYLEQSSNHLRGFFFEVDLSLHQVIWSRHTWLRCPWPTSVGWDSWSAWWRRRWPLFFWAATVPTVPESS